MAKETVAIKIVNGNNRHDKQDRHRSHGKWNEAAGKQEHKCF
jgi:hypothetical protein